MHDRALTPGRARATAQDRAVTPGRARATVQDWANTPGRARATAPRLAGDKWLLTDRSNDRTSSVSKAATIGGTSKEMEAASLVN